MHKTILTIVTLLSLFTIAHATEYVIVPESSEARYRVTEQLANVSLPNDAVGVTSEVTGSIWIDDAGEVLPESKIVVGLSALQSDESRRDRFIKENTLQTDQYPNAVFVPTELRGLEFPFPDSGEAEFEILGELTIRDVTRPVVWQATVVVEDDTAHLTATTSITFDAFDLTQPRVFLVLSIEDTIELEVDLTLQQQPEQS